MAQQHLQQPKTQLEQDKEKIDNIFKNVHSTNTAIASFISTASPVPVVAAFMSVICYLALSIVQVSVGQYSGWVRVIAVGGGTLITLLVWVIVALCYRNSTNVNRANISGFELLMNRLSQVASWLAGIENAPQATCPVPSGTCEEARRLKPILEINKREVRDTFESICDDLQRKRNMSWMWAIGYVDVWKHMHRIDETFVYLEPRELVIHDALHDELSLKDSTVDNRDELLTQLRRAVTILNADAAGQYLSQQAPRQEASKPGAANESGNSTTPAVAQSAVQAALVNTQGRPISSSAAQSCPHHVPGEAQARAVIKHVRYTLHQFRDDCWEKLVRVRNHLMRLTMLTAVTIYAMVVFAIIAGAASAMLEAATAYFLTGTIVGLFSRLYEQSKNDASVDDFRLAGARVMAAVIFSGLASVGGVLVQNLSPGDSFAKLTLTNVLVAAAFGLTPGLFANAIQKQTDQYKADLKSTGAPAGNKTKAMVST